MLSVCPTANKLAARMKNTGIAATRDAKEERVDCEKFGSFRCGIVGPLLKKWLSKTWKCALNSGLESGADLLGRTARIVSQETVGLQCADRGGLSYLPSAQLHCS